MKKFILSLGFAAVSLLAGATDYPYLAIHQKNGDVSTLDADGLTISVVDNQLVFNINGQTSSYALADLVSMNFTTEMSAVNGTALAGDGEVTVYTASGVMTGKYESAASARAAITAPGVYVFKSNGETTKVVITK